MSAALDLRTVVEAPRTYPVRWEVTARRCAAPSPEEPAGDEDDEESGSTNDPDDADCDDEEEVTTAPEGAQERRPVESSVTPTTDEPRCTAHGCTKPAAPAIATTHPELREFCGDHRVSARRLRFNRGMEAAAAAQELRERGYVPLGPPPATKAAPARSAPSTRCPCHGCAEPSAPALAATAPELRDLCKAHRTRARDLIFKLPEYTPALARERVITGQRPAALGPAPSASERGRRGGTARSKVLRPAVAETVRRVPATPGAPAPASVLTALAPAGSPLGERVAVVRRLVAVVRRLVAVVRRLVAVVRRLVACEARAGGVEVVEQLVELAARCGGAGELAALVDAVLGEVSRG